MVNLAAWFGQPGLGEQPRKARPGLFFWKERRNSQKSNSKQKTFKLTQAEEDVTDRFNLSWFQVLCLGNGI